MQGKEELQGCLLTRYDPKSAAYDDANTEDLVTGLHGKSCDFSPARKRQALTGKNLLGLENKSESWL